MPLYYVMGSCKSVCQEGEKAHQLLYSGSKQNWRSLGKALSQRLEVPVYALVRINAAWIDFYSHCTMTGFEKPWDFSTHHHDAIRRNGIGSTTVF